MATVATVALAVSVGLGSDVRAGPAPAAKAGGALPSIGGANHVFAAGSAQLIVHNTSAGDPPRDIHVPRDIANPASATARRLQQYDAINISVEPRGGFGDVAAGYLTALEIVARHGYRKPVRLITGKEGLEVLAKMTGIADLAAGGRIADGAIRLHSHQPLQSSSGGKQLFLALAVQKSALPARRAIAPDGTFVSMPVLGNTEAQLTSGVRTYARISLPGLERGLEVRPAGFGIEESGVYFDPVAATLRGKSAEEVDEFLRSELHRVEDIGTRSALSSLINEEALENSRVGVMYSAALEREPAKYREVVQELQDKAAEQGESYVLLRPTREGDGSPSNYAGTGKAPTTIRAGEPLPERLQPGEVVVLEIGALPHSLYVGMMAKAETTLILDGDAATSAALTLGKPYAPGYLPWAQANHKRFGDRVQEKLGSSNEQAKIKSLFDLSRISKGSALRGAWDLADPPYRHAFKQAADDVGYFVESLMASVEQAHRQLELPPAVRDLTSVDDPVLRAALLATTAADGEGSALNAFRRFAADEPSTVAEMWLRDVVPTELMKDAQVRSALESSSDYTAQGALARLEQLE